MREAMHLILFFYSDATYFDGRCAMIVGPNGEDLGRVGVIHPEVVTNFELTMPCSALDLRIQPFL